MKIVVAKFTLEANEYVDFKCDLGDVALSFGDDALSHMQLGEVFIKNNVEVIPAICADAGCSGIMKRHSFNYIEESILRAIKENLNGLDGIYLHLHGASYIEEIGSGDHHIVRKIREIIGPYMPLCVVCDPHGNLTKEYVENTTYIRSYRESPHIDIAQTIHKTCEVLIDQIKHPTSIKPIYRKLPLILGGEQSVSKDEPVYSINKYLDNLENDERILSASWHVGYLRHDCPEAGCGIVVIPSDAKHEEYAIHQADLLMDYVWNKRHEFHYSGLTLNEDEALDTALKYQGKPVFITDSGDNVTSGSLGINTTVLKQFLNVNSTKKVLFAAINHGTVCNFLYTQEVGSKHSISLGVSKNELSAPTSLEVELKYKGFQEGTYMYGEKGNYGKLVTVHIVDTNIDITITANNHSFVEIHQLDACGINYKNYDIIVVKQGYIHPELSEVASMSIMSLTNGTTVQDTRRIPFKLIMRPMYPIDNI
ncbi:M81 family metallopeptidase [Anaerorhabdus sp.]|uniref:M81 family metallopeptidase n=1 Tax=Anaerorhabdus sp. TaxID=1872524 RepID=UPI002FC64702